jgi:hypothetical protein
MNNHKVTELNDINIINYINTKITDKQYINFSKKFNLLEEIP